MLIRIDFIIVERLLFFPKYVGTFENNNEVYFLCIRVIFYFSYFLLLKLSRMEIGREFQSFKLIRPRNRYFLFISIGNRINNGEREVE